MNKYRLKIIAIYLKKSDSIFRFCLISHKYNKLIKLYDDFFKEKYLIIFENYLRFPNLKKYNIPIEKNRYYGNLAYYIENINLNDIFMQVYDIVYVVNIFKKGKNKGICMVHVMRDLIYNKSLISSEYDDFNYIKTHKMIILIKKMRKIILNDLIRDL